MRPVQSVGRQCQGHPVDGAPVQSVDKQCARAERRTVLIIPSTYTDLGCQGTRRLLHQQTFVTPSAIFFMSLGPHVGAQYLCACPPFSYKRGGMRRYK
jgi:hypothetical protein